MMHGRGKSDAAIVAGKPANKAERSAAEPVERRAETKGNASQQSTRRTQSRASVSQALERIRQAARTRKKERFTALLHHISRELLEEAFFALKENAAPGVDGLTWQDYEQTSRASSRTCMRGSIGERTGRCRHGGSTYPSRMAGSARWRSPRWRTRSSSGRRVAVLNAIYEEDFLGFSYGFRPGRSPHDALDALVVGIERRKVNLILDADIRSFFDTVNQEWLIRFVEHRIGDRRIIRLIRKWLKAGVLEDGVVTRQ